MTILITTHSMEEADALCSRIAIMTKKGLQCIGDQIHLKNKYGKGFLLSIALNDSISDVCGYVKTHICPQAEFFGSQTEHSHFHYSERESRSFQFDSSNHETAEG